VNSTTSESASIALGSQRGAALIVAMVVLVLLASAILLDRPWLAPNKPLSRGLPRIRIPQACCPFPIGTTMAHTTARRIVSARALSRPGTCSGVFLFEENRRERGVPQPSRCRWNSRTAPASGSGTQCHGT
jgi:hypothetical protein